MAVYDSHGVPIHRCLTSPARTHASSAAYRLSSRMSSLACARMRVRVERQDTLGAPNCLGEPPGRVSEIPWPGSACEDLEEEHPFQTILVVPLLGCALRRHRPCDSSAGRVASLGSPPAGQARPRCCACSGALPAAPRARSGSGSSSAPLAPPPAPRARGGLLLLELLAPSARRAWLVARGSRAYWCACLLASSSWWAGAAPRACGRGPLVSLLPAAARVQRALLALRSAGARVLAMCRG